MSDYFDPTTVTIAAGTRALASQVNAVSAAISAGFDKLPTETELKLGLTRYAVDTGVADAYIVTLPYVPVLTDGFNLSFKAVNANTGACTINVNGTGVKSIVNPDGTALIAGTFGSNAIVIIAYESIGDRYILVSQNPAQSALAQASAAAAAISESNAATSETNAGVSETNALASELAAAASYDSFDDRYLGPKASDPTLDNDGNALIDGALYWNTTLSPQQMKAWDGTAMLWRTVFASGDADTLDGLDSTQFLRSDVSSTLTGDLTIDQTASALYIGSQVADDTAKSTRMIVDPTNGDHDWYLSRGVQWSGAQWELAVAGSSPTGIFFNGDGTQNGLVVVAAGNHNSLAAGANVGRPEDFPAVLELSGLSGIARLSTNGTTRLTVGDSEITSRNRFRLTTGGEAIVMQEAAAMVGAVTSGNGALWVRNDVPTTLVFRDDAGTDFDVAGAAVDAVTLGANSFTDTQTVTISTTGDEGIVVSSAVASRTVPLVDIANSNSTGADANAIALKVTQNQGTYALDLVHENALGIAQRIYSNTASRGGDLLQVHVDNATQGAGANAIRVIHDGAAGRAISVEPNGAGNYGIYAYSNTASRTVPIVQIINDNPTGTGEALNIDNDSAGDGINVSGGLGRAINASSSGAAVSVVLINKFSNDGNALEAIASSGTTTTAARLSSAVANRTVPVVEIINDSTTGSGIALQIQQDNSAPHIELIGANGEGIEFPSTANPSTNVNTLDDYREGTWTPVIQDTTQSDAEGQTYSTQTGTYTKIGKRVFFECYLSISSLGTLSGNMYIAGLPFVSVTSTGDKGAVTVYCVGASITAGQSMVGRVLSNSSRVILGLWDSTGGVGTLQNGSLGSTPIFNISGSYETDA